MPIKENIEKVRKELPKDVILVAATKSHSIEEIKEAVNAGIEIIGENYVQEAEEKFKELKGRVKFHCIGHLQKNKVKKAVEIFDMVQAVDSLEIAEEISKRCRAINKIMPVLVEINSGKEPNKSGVMPEYAEELIKQTSILQNIKVKGLMAMAPFFDNPEECRPYFRLTRELFDKIRASNISNRDMEILSMGMSDSYRIAVEEGANMVRIGTQIFGPR